MARKKLIKTILNFGEYISAPSSLLVHYFIWQAIVITIYIGSRDLDDFIPLVSNGLYLGTISIATLALVLHLFLITASRKLDKYDLSYLFIFMLPMIFLYSSMFINFDFRSIQSLTLLFITLVPLVVWRTDFSKRDSTVFNYTIMSYSILNLVYVILQILRFIPVAQVNSREISLILSNRPTGLLFNAFAMSYASVICIAIGLHLLFKNKNKVASLIIFISSLISLLLSGTRTSIWLGFLVVVTFLLIYKIKNLKVNKILIPLFLMFLGVSTPFILSIIGNTMGLTEWATINGRTQMWVCVMDKFQEFIPFGVGLDEAFPPKFCAQTGWFSNLRHPENMFLLAFVESGPLGLLTYIILFSFTLWKSTKALRNKLILPLVITTTFLLSNLIYVSLFHYLPFLSNRPADRGIFNFHFFYLIWIWIMKETKVKLEKKV